jgi:UDP-GlcNAc:undecaprenyl-phosphate GlcNAc-1-phosphate transferase
MLVLFATAALASALLTPLVATGARRLGILDPPGPRKAHADGVPRLGGLAVVAAALLGMAAHVRVSGDPWPLSLGPLLAGGSIVFVVGLVDDVRSVSAPMKLAVELLAAAVVALQGVTIGAVTLLGITVPMGGFAIPITIAWIVGLTNAFNLIDGLDGLATGVALISGTTCALILVVRGNRDEAAVLTALVGAAAGFLPYNFSSARIFLGDCGSLVFGFVLAVTAITGFQKGATALSAGAPLLLFALPIVEAVASVLRRSISGTRQDGWRGLWRVLVADQEHIHHRLVAAGLSPRSVVLLLYTFTLGLSLVALATVRSGR